MVLPSRISHQTTAVTATTTTTSTTTTTTLFAKNAGPSFSSDDPSDGRLNGGERKKKKKKKNKSKKKQINDRTKPANGFGSTSSSGDDNGIGSGIMEMKEDGIRFFTDDEELDKPIPFVNDDGSGYIECYAESVATINGVDYTIGAPCDNPVALCFFDTNGDLQNMDLDSEVMDDVYPVASRLMDDEFGEDLVLQRTAQTLTIVGDLEEINDDVDEEEEIDENDVGDDEEQVEIILSFEHVDTEYHLVKILDPVLLVGKAGESIDRRTLLTQEESNRVMPAIENLVIQKSLQG